MLIINADDWGGWRAATDAIVMCFRQGRITSTSAMVFMEDSERSAELAKDIGLDVGLHVNLTQSLSGGSPSAAVVRAHERVGRFLNCSRYAQLLYHPRLRGDFRIVYEAQADEFRRLYECEPSHVDGHRHMHLCANMLAQALISPGQVVRRNFSFWPGQRGAANRLYRSVVDKWLARRYRLADYFFSLGQCLQMGWLSRVAELARIGCVELMTHPEHPEEQAWLCSERAGRLLAGKELITARRLRGCATLRDGSGQQG